jgi:fibronectin-binding autotransporter adhesin
VAEPITIAGTGISNGGALVFTAGNNTYSGAITLAASTPLIKSTGGQQTISGAITGAQALTITATDSLTLSGTIGATAPPTSVSVTTTGGDLNLSSYIISAGNIVLTAEQDILFRQGFTKVESTGSGSYLNLLAKRNISNNTADVTDPSVTLVTNNGNILVSSNTDNSGGGVIALTEGSTFTSTGGNITIAGGSLTGTGYAEGYSSWEEGLRLDNTVSIASSGGHIILRGQSYSATSITDGRGAAGISFYRGAVSINSGTGTILIDAKGYSYTSKYSSALHFGLETLDSSTAVTIQSANTSASAITINANHYTNGASGRGWTSYKPVYIYATANGGGITINASNTSTTGVSYIWFLGEVRILATSGAIQILGGTTNYFTLGTSGAAADLFLGSKSGVSGNTTSSSNITFESDDLQLLEGSNFNFATTGTVTIQPKSTSFSRAISLSWFDLNQNSQTMTGFTFGKSTNTQNIVLDQTLTVTGPIAVYGGDIYINGNITSNTSGNITLSASNQIFNDGTTRYTITSSSAGDIYLIADSDGTGTLKIGYTTLSAGRNLYLRSNLFSWSTASIEQFPYINGTGGVTIDSTATGFGQNVSTNWFNWNSGISNIASKITSLTIGKSTNTTYNVALSAYTLNSITYSLSVNGPITAYGANITLTGTTTSASGSSLFTGLLGELGAANFTQTTGSLQVSAPGDSAYSGAIGGGGSFVKSGSGNLTLSGTNTYTGATTISDGTLTVSGTLADTTAVTVASGKTYNVNATDTIGSLAGAGTVQTSGTVTLTSGGDNTSTIFSGVIQNGTGTLSLTKSGSGTLTLSGANTYSGSTTLTAGSILVGNAGSGNVGSITNSSVGTGTLIFNGGTISSDSSTARTINNPITYTGNVTFGDGTNNGALTFAAAEALGAANRTLTVNTTGGVTLSGIISSTGAYGITKAGAGTLTLSGTNTYSGGTTISAGTLKIDNAAALGASSGAASITSGAVLDLNGITMTNTNALTVNGTGISTNGAIINSSSTGATYAGLLTLGSDSSIVGGTGTITISNVGTITGSGLGLTLGGAQGGTLTSILGTGTGTLTKQNAGTWNLAGVNTFTGNTTISGGTLAITGSGQLNSGTYSGAIAIASSSTFKYSSSANQTLQTGVISGAGNLIKDTDTSSILTLSATNTYTGTTTINAGTLSISTIANVSTNSNLGAASSGNIIINGGILKYTGSGSSSNRNITLGSSGGTIDASGSGTLTLTGGITPTASTSPTLTLTGSGNGTLSTAAYATPATSGTSALTKSGNGTWTLSFANTYIGATTISAGTLSVTALNALGTNASGTTIASGATLDLQGVAYSTTEGLTVNGGTIKTSTGTSSFAGTISLGANSTVDVGGTQLTLSGIISSTSTHSLTKTSSGILILTGNNSYTGGTTINAGTLNMGHANAISTSGTITFGGGTLQHSSSNTTDYSSRFSTTASQAYNIDTSNQNVTLATALTSSGGSLTKSGSGTLTLSGNNTYTGATTISDGTLTVSGTLADTTAVTVASGKTYNVNATDTIGSLAGAGTVQTSGTVTLTSGGDNTSTIFSGVIQNGTGTLSLTKSGSGTLTLSGTNTYTGGTNVNAGTLILDHTSTGTVLADTGAVIVNGGTLQLNDTTETVGTVTLTSGSITVGTAGNALTGTSYTLNPSSGDHSISAVLAGGASVALTKSGAGTVTLSGTNTYTGGTNVNAGTLILDHASTGTLADTGAVIVNGGTLQLTDTTETVGAVTLTSGSITVGTTGNILTGTSYTLNPSSGDHSISAVLAGDASVALTKSGAGTVTLSGTNTYTGLTTVSAGSLTYGIANNAISFRRCYR